MHVYIPSMLSETCMHIHTHIECILVEHVSSKEISFDMNITQVPSAILIYKHECASMKPNTKQTQKGT